MQKAKILTGCLIAVSLTGLVSCSSEGNEKLANQQAASSPKSHVEETSRSKRTKIRATPLGANGSDDSEESNFRDGVTVEDLYVQKLGDPYSTSWLGRLEKQDGPWRDVYLETSEKLVDHGILSFRCDGNASVAWVTYDEEQFGSPSARHIASVPVTEFTKWKAGGLDKIGPPFELYQIVRSKFC